MGGVAQDAFCNSDLSDHSGGSSGSDGFTQNILDKHYSVS